MLSSNQTLYRARNYTFKQYKTKGCKTCPVRSECTNAKVNGKIVQRTQYAAHIEANAQRVAENKGLYRQRQALVEHPFGTMKRQWGFDHIMTKRGISAASADMGLIALAYNLRRLFNIRASKPKELSGMFKVLFMSILVLKRHFWRIWVGYYKIPCILGKEISIRQILFLKAC